MVGSYIAPCFLLKREFAIEKGIKMTKNLYLLTDDEVKILKYIISEHLSFLYSEMQNQNFNRFSFNALKKEILQVEQLECNFVDNSLDEILKRTTLNN